jgi:hypothetical protein
MQLFGRGLRRRLPTMLDGDPARIRMVYSLAFALPGAPVLFYGEEIGMAENLAIPGRMSVRAPMQWSNEPNGGFSTAAPDKLRRPVVEGKKWGPAAINVADQQRDAASLLELDGAPDPPPARDPGDRLRRMEPGAGARRRRSWRCATTGAIAHVLVIHNLSAKPHRTSFKLEPAAGETG